MIISRFIDLPISVKGFTIQDYNNDYNIYINTKHLSQQREIMEHELRHIRNGDFDKILPAHIIERLTNG